MKQMRCTQVHKRLSAYQDGALGKAQHSAVADHLAHCPDCAALAAELQHTWQALDSGDAVDTAPGFVAEVMRRLQTELPRPVWHAPRWAVVAALVLCVSCGGLAGYVHSNAQPTVVVTQIALATDISWKLGLEAFAPAPADTLAGAYVQFAGTESGR